jgi:hypothetical protein
MPSQRKNKKQVAVADVNAADVNAADVNAADVNAADVNAESPAVDDKKKSPLIGNIHISRARCEWHFRNSISDESIETQIKALKELQKATTDENELKTNKVKIDELNKNLIRISQYTPHAISIICDLVIKDMISRGISQIAQSGKKTLDTSYFYSSDINESYLYPLIKNLSTYTDGYKKVEDMSKKKLKKSDEEDAPTEDGGDTDVEELGSSNMTFTTYINKAIIDIKKSLDTKITIGTKVKKYLSDLLTELINRLALMAKALLKNVINVRTIAPNHIKAIISLLLLDGNVSEADVEKAMATVDEKLKLFQQAMVKELKTEEVVAVEGAVDDAVTDPVV